jgi:hypothetical protein
MLQFLENCLTFKYLSVDTEGNLLGISLATPTLQSMYFPIGHIQNVNIDEEVKQKLYHVITTVSYRVMHHAGHDIIILPEIFELPFVCTMIVAHMVDENVPSKSLDYLHKYYCTDRKKKHKLVEAIDKTIDYKKVPVEQQVSILQQEKSLGLYEKDISDDGGKKMHPLMASIIKTMGWEYVPIELMNEYASEDALITMELFIQLLPKYEKQFGSLW